MASYEVNIQNCYKYFPFPELNSPCPITLITYFKSVTLFTLGPEMDSKAGHFQYTFLRLVAVALLSWRATSDYV
jgi:hypothetical protein